MSVVGEEADLVVPLSGGCVETVVLELAVDGALQDCPCRVKHLFQQGCRLFFVQFFAKSLHILLQEIVSFFENLGIPC